MCVGSSLTWQHEDVAFVREGAQFGSIPRINVHPRRFDGLPTLEGIGEKGFNSAYSPDGLLDGSSGNAGRMTTKTTFNFLAGVDCVLTARISGNQRAQAADTLNFGIDGIISNGASRNGGDNIGAILDNVQLTDNTDVVPLPTALPLMAAGLGAFGFMGWRRKKA